MAEQIEPSPLRQAGIAAAFIAVSATTAILTEVAIALAAARIERTVRRWFLPAWEGPHSPQSPIAVDADPGGQLAEQLVERLAAEQLVDQLDDQTAGVVVDLGDGLAAIRRDGLEAIAE